MHSVKRILSIIPILILTSIVLFFIMEILPGDVTGNFMGTQTVSEEQLAAMRIKFGLDKPVAERYWNWLSGIFRGDFGKSWMTSTPITEQIARRLPITLELTFLSLLVSLIIAIPIGISSALHRNSLLDIGLNIPVSFGLAVPGFWFGMLLVLLFSVTFKWLPASGYVPIGENLGKNLLHMIMPAISVGVPFAAEITRQSRSAMLDVLDQEYIVTARSKGLKQHTVVWRHAFKNALIPIITVVSMQFSRLIAGAVICETVFQLPGMGKRLVDAVTQRDTPVVMGFIMVIAIMVIAVNTLVDLIYIWVDPRISQESR